MNEKITQNKRLILTFYVTLWVLPLLVGILWGPYFDADTYRTLRQARAIRPSSGHSCRTFYIPAVHLGPRHTNGTRSADTHRRSRAKLSGMGTSRDDDLSHRRSHEIDHLQAR